ncbi:MAG: serine/threonine-protein kinase, partial [Myxococcota bacterium]
MTSAGGVRTEVAVKILRGDIDPGSDSVKRLRDEGRLLGALSHPAILRVHDLVLLQNRVALVTEFVEGEDLDSCLAADPPLPTRAMVGVLGEVAAALDVAWNTPSPQGGPMHLVHRDVKPANIRLGRHGEVKLLDFGIARATNLDREAQTANNAMLGSYLYMAPERFHEEKVEPPSDVYALGCILYEGLTRHRLFEGMTLKQIYGTMLLSRKFNSHVDDRLKRIAPDTPDGVVSLLRTMLEVDPGARPTASQVARQCEDLAETLPGPTLKRWARSREWAAQPQITGSLDGYELSAESFDASQRGGPDPRPGNTTPEPPRPIAAAQRASSGSTPPGAPADDLPLAGLLTLPGVQPGDVLDAPVAGLVSREMVRMSEDEIAKIRSEADEGANPGPMRIAVGASRTPSAPPPRTTPPAHAMTPVSASAPSGVFPSMPAKITLPPPSVASPVHAPTVALVSSPTPSMSGSSVSGSSSSASPAALPAQRPPMPLPTTSLVPPSSTRVRSDLPPEPPAP